MFFDALWKINGRHLQMSICIKFTMGIEKEVRKGMNVDCDFGGKNAVVYKATGLQFIPYISFLDFTNIF